MDIFEQPFLFLEFETFGPYQVHILYIVRKKIISDEKRKY